MGHSYTLACTQCGYRDHVSDGSGMSVQVLEPRLCSCCMRVVTVMMSAPDPDQAGIPISAEETYAVGVCPECGRSEHEPWGSFGRDDEGGGTLEELMSPREPEPGSCPRCGGQIRLSLEALWD